MNVTLGDIQNAKDTLSKLANMDLPIKTSYALSKLIKILNEEYMHIEDFRTQLVRKYGDPEGDNIRVIPESENFFEFMKDYTEFMESEIELNSPKIDIDVNSDMQVKPIDIITVEKFVNFIGVEETE